ncbi:hypothetical protein O6H91_18G020700 [Diphasiastrum complanatum]|uniref:Uncharacterized protein n=1 Tax=Diphasiastrum complanatum TaxID=34168 RepID=A0ACC2AYS6_DIPCM|nr:hypothetical protein O6H91_Y431400 [Diphasiastrum complanatum]KAJ7522635.1 hypothetical protein O6H91_18G020700 [Diphasiastrum complanatum]
MVAASLCSSRLPALSVHPDLLVFPPVCSESSTVLPSSTMVAMEEKSRRRLRLLCLHGFRTSASVLEKQLGKWSSSIHDLLDLTFLDAPFPATGKSDVEGMFPPPFFEWFLSNSDYTVYNGFEESMKYISDYLKQHGPFDGLLGFSQGAMIASYLTCLQKKGLALQNIDPLRLLVVIGGAKFKSERMAFAYPGITQCSSIHFLGEKDFLLPYGQDLVKSFYNPLVINHRYGHTIPRLDDEATSQVVGHLLQVIDQISKDFKETVEEIHISV